ncbi:MAG: collagen-like protein [Polyangiaceae bacterium]|nr:collagen-like protein [Myxococcales bacterium]MCB9584653.1 collagen-like protein [Polyangiaceae bacterium]MCB9609090.1 collagen-like protein [Polyangiaceae bacterium]
MKTAYERRAQLLLIASVLGLGTGCGFLKNLVGRNVVDLEQADVRSMSVDIRKTQKTICPRERVQMAVFVEAKLEGEDQVAQFETFKGNEGRNHKLEFNWFAFHSEQGSFDAEGWFTPNPDLTLTASQEFQLKTVYRKRPDQFSFDTTYKPDYSCISSAGADGQFGSAGVSGNGGNQGESGQSNSDAPGGDGGDGQAGGDAGPGGNGGDGPRVEAYATYVKTAFYEKLVAVVVEGGSSDVLLFHPENQFTVFAAGGSGGPGGIGGMGGRGGRGGDGNPSGSGGRGGPGGRGGVGGNGGAGGVVVLHLDERFPELRNHFRVDVSGGAGGPGGGAGSGGEGGDAGSVRVSSGPDGTTPQGTEGARGAQGPQGSAGSPGNAGPAGNFDVRLEPLGAQFSGLNGVSVL